MDIFKFKLLEKESDIKHGISTKAFGSMKKSDNSLSRKNIESFLEKLNMPKNAVCMHQVHGSRVGVVENSQVWQIQDVDGLITNKKNIPLCVVVADCLPLFFYDRKKEVIGIGHGGRRGIELGLVENMISKIRSEFGSSPADIVIGIGPGIEQECYEVDGVFMDLRKIVIDKLLLAGVEKGNIESMDMCTKDNPELFYSYRAGDVFKRFIGIISLI